MTNLKNPSEFYRTLESIASLDTIQIKLHRGSIMVDIWTYLWVFRLVFCTLAIQCEVTVPHLYFCLPVTYGNMSGWGRVLLTGEELSFPPPTQPPELSSPLQGEVVFYLQNFAVDLLATFFEPVEMFFRYNATLSQGENAHNRGLKGAQHRGRAFRSIFLLGDELTFCTSSYSMRNSFGLECHALVILSYFKNDHKYSLDDKCIHHAFENMAYRFNF